MGLKGFKIEILDVGLKPHDIIGIMKYDFQKLEKEYY
jgi:hypothetical protein